MANSGHPTTRGGQLSLPIPPPQPTPTPAVQLRTLPGTTWQHIFEEAA